MEKRNLSIASLDTECIEHITSEISKEDINSFVKYVLDINASYYVILKFYNPSSNQSSDADKAAVEICANFGELSQDFFNKHERLYKTLGILVSNSTINGKSIKDIYTEKDKTN